MTPKLQLDYVITRRSSSSIAGNLTGNEQGRVLEFDPAKSYAICIEIDKRQKLFTGNSLSSAESLGNSFVTNMGMQKERVRIYTSANQPELCSKQAIRTLLLNYAREVEENGMFAFYFSGHAVVYKGSDSKDEWIDALVLGDYTGDVAQTGMITADDFVGWLQQANCKARHILIILDCCFAGELGKKIVSKADIRPQIHVMCACSSSEATVAMNILGSSIFCYFLLHILKKHQPKGKFAIDENMDEIAELCLSFSSLLMCYTSEYDGVLKPALIEPEIYNKESNRADSHDETDNDSHWLNKLYDEKAEKPSLHLVAREWLKSKLVKDSLRLLLSINPMPESLYNGILCALFYSVSCMHLAYDRTHITERNFFITVAISIMSAIGLDVTFTKEQLMMGIKFYYIPINSTGIPTSSIESLLMELHVNGGNGD